jgi:hypothetical protein
MSVAVRFDASTGVEERLEHLESPNGLLYSWTARPSNAVSCVVICSSILGDFTANYHRERQLGRALAANGCGVIRFHYAGDGNSTGERRSMTFGTMCDDSMVAITHATSLGFENIGLVGTRLGALIAAKTVSDFGPAPLAIWEPVSDPMRFIRDAQRAKRMSQVVQEQAQETTDWRQELEQRGELDLLGYTVYPNLIESLSGVDLITSLGLSPRPLLIARFRARESGSDPLAKELIPLGFAPVFQSFGVPESWWLPSENIIESTDLVNSTRDWFSGAFEGIR